MRLTTHAAAILLASIPLLTACSGGGPVIKGLDPDPVLATGTMPPGAFNPAITTARATGNGSVRYINPFRPEQLRIHPLTRFITDPVDGDTRIDAHFELFDTHRDPVKALGVVSFQLYRDDASTGSPIQLQRWQIDLTNPAANAEPYDRVTRTYRLSLRGLTDPITQSTRLVLLAQFTTPEGQTLSATHRF